LGSIGLDLGQLCLRGGSGNEDPAGDTCGCAIGGDRGPGVARGVFDYERNAQLLNLADEKRRASILEGTGREEEVKLEKEMGELGIGPEQWSEGFSYAHRFTCGRKGKGLPISPELERPGGERTAGEGDRGGKIQVGSAFAEPPVIFLPIGPSA
jgi:hypothetical protein